MTDNGTRSKPSVRVKPLEWEHWPYGDLIRAETIIDTYRVWTHHDADGRWFWSLNGVADGHAWTEEDAKDAAQADYNARILSAIEETEE